MKYSFSNYVETTIQKCKQTIEKLKNENKTKLKQKKNRNKKKTKNYKYP